MKRLIRYSRAYYPHIIVAALASIGCSLAGVWIIDILKEIIDSTVNGNIADILPNIAARAAVLVLFGMLSNYLVIHMTGYLGAGILRDLRDDTLEHIMKTSPDFMEKNNFGDICERLSSDIDNLATYMKTYFKDCLYVPIIVVVYTVYLLRINILLGVLCLIPLCVLVPLSTKLLNPVKRSQQEYVRLLGLTNNNIQEAYDAADIIKSYNLQRKIKDKYYKALKETLDMSHKNDLRQYNINPITAMIGEIPVAVALCVGGWLVFEGNLTIGTMVAVISVIGKLIDPLRETYQLVVRSQLAMISLNRVFYILDLPVEKQQTERIRKTGECTFELKNVSFSYDSRRSEDTRTLSEVNLTVKRGRKVALIGKSGSGKSTILKLLCRQYEADSGDILYYGNNYKDMPPGIVRDDIALISQDTVLFPMSVADNIRIGNPDATREQIIEAAKAAECHTFIKNMPNGYDTVLTENGSNLSGGQRQRIAIARAILKDAEVLILDEPTSALDKETEENVCKTLARISKGKTVVTVAHRLSTIADYDEIIEIGGGEC